MKKFFIAYLLVAGMSIEVMAGTTGSVCLLQNQIKSDEAVKLFEQFPELEGADIAEVSVVRFDDNDFSLKLYSQNSNDVYLIHKKNGELETTKSFIPFEVTTKTVEGEIKGTLYETVFKDTGSELLALQMSEAFKEDFLSTKGLKVGASYSFDVIEYFDNDRFIKFGDIQSARLIVGQAESKRVLKQDLNTLRRSLVPEMPEENNRPFYAPVKMSRVSSLFNLARRHPVKRRIQPHNGIDFVARSGTPVFPALEGEIIAMGRAKAKGKFILIQHENGYQTTYDHLRKFKKGLRVGMRVELNDQIGEVGRTGFATGAHLHFGVLQEGLYVNPLYLVKDYTFDQKDQFETSDLEEEQAVADTSAESIGSTDTEE